MLSIILIIIVAVPSFSKNVYAKTMDEKIVDKQIAELKKKKISGYKFHEAYAVKFTGKNVEEIVVSSYGFEKGTNYIDKSLLQVYQYNASQKKWKILKEFVSKNDVFTYSPLSFITKGKLVNSKKEALVVGHRWGNDYTLSPMVLGSVDGKTVKMLISPKNKSFTDGTAIIKGRQLYFINFLSTVSERYAYKNGKLVKYKGTGSDDRKVAGGAKHLLLLEKKYGKFSLTGNKNIRMKVGESFSIIRKNKSDRTNYIYRFLINLNDKGPLKNNGGSLKAVKPGDRKSVV